MLDLDQAIIERYSTRKFLPEPVPRGLVERPSPWPSTRRRTQTFSHGG
jgi:hypothetical protein